MASEMTIQAHYVLGTQFDIKTSSGQHMIIDGAEQHMGVSPMEMRLVGLAGCMGISVISVLQKKR